MATIKRSSDLLGCCTQKKVGSVFNEYPKAKSTKEEIYYNSLKY